MCQPRLTAVGDLPRRHFEVGGRVDGNDCGAVDYVAGQARPAARAGRRPNPVPAGVLASGLRRLRTGERGDDGGGSGAVAVSTGRSAASSSWSTATPASTSSLCSSAAAPSNDSAEPFRPRVGAWPCAIGSTAPSRDAGQHDLGGVVADVDARDHDHDRQRNRPRRAYTTAAWRTSSAHREAPRASSDARRASNSSAVERCGRSAS